VIIDSDELRAILTPSPRYDDAERDWFYGVIADLAAWLTGSGVHVIIAATAHRRAYRDAARARIARFAEVEVRCPPDVLRQRDPKRLYEWAARGEVRDVPGVDLPYESAPAPELVIHTAHESPATGAHRILDRLTALSSESQRT
jgi:adenylylsulfate kinase